MYIFFRGLYNKSPSHTEFLGCGRKLYRHSETSTSEVCHKLLKTSTPRLQGNPPDTMTTLWSSLVRIQNTMQTCLSSFRSLIYKTFFCLRICFRHSVSILEEVRRIDSPQQAPVWTFWSCLNSTTKRPSEPSSHMPLSQGQGLNWVDVQDSTMLILKPVLCLLFYCH